MYPLMYPKVNEDMWVYPKVTEGERTAKSSVSR